jgi:hypothetical protein
LIAYFDRRMDFMARQNDIARDAFDDQWQQVGPWADAPRIRQREGDGTIDNET